ncbi:MAG: hypothetical protein QXD51_04660 [Candidatus Anstonellales archaeon]
MCGGGQDYGMYLTSMASDRMRKFQNPYARTSIRLAEAGGSVRTVQMVERLLEQRPFSSEEVLYRMVSHFNGRRIRPRESPAIRLLNKIIGASGERAEQVLEQIEIMVGRGMLNGNAEKRLTQILRAVQSDRVFPDLAVANLRREWEAPTASS